MSFDRFIALPRRSRNVLFSLIENHAVTTDQTHPARPFRPWIQALRSIWRERYEILLFMRTGDANLAQNLRRKFGLAASLPHAQHVPPDLFNMDSLPRAEPATIIVPIYRAERALARLLVHLPKTLNADQKVILVDDGSNCLSVDRLLSGFPKVHSQTQVLKLRDNVGFVAAVNKALTRVSPTHHAILLNTDTLPPPDWVPRLLAPFSECETIASATPISNNAEILSVPRAGIETDIDERFVSFVDSTARRLKPGPTEMPTGIGFCLALNRRFLDRIGHFDPAFGRGYGEEVDWCQRASRAGGRHVVVTNLFVGHEGGASFGLEERKKRISQSGREIAKRYPDYPRNALDWESNDPIGAERLALGIAWAAARSDGPVSVYIAHAMGGGAETALRHEVDARLASNAPAVIILRAGGPARWRVELQGERFAIGGDVSDDDMVHQLLAPLTDREVIYSCGVGAADPGRLPDMLLDLSRHYSLKIRIHDFFAISPSWNLIGSDGCYTGVPPINTEDPAHACHPTTTTPGMSHRDWRTAWGQAISAAEEITTFARSGSRLIEEAYGQAKGKTVIRPHRLSFLPGRVAPGGSAIGVLGGVNRAKGGAVLQSLAPHIDRRMVVIGELDGQFQLPPPHLVHGPYHVTDIARLARGYDVGVWFIPSICPETFSFATHEALATGLPVASFDIGAQAEALSAARNGRVLRKAPEDCVKVAAALEGFFVQTG